MASTIDVADWLSTDTTPGSAPASHSCGLFVANPGQTPLPLRTRTVKAHVYAEHGFCEVHEELAYVADEDCSVRFVFPVPPRSAVFKFKATIGDRQVTTEVKRKAAAQEEYDDAVRQGHTAVHMQQQAGESLFSVEVGNLCAMEEALVTFSYVRLLNCMAGAVEFEHQATWVPPYLKPSEVDAGGNPAGSVAAANPVFADKVSYQLTYHIVVQSSRGFRSIESPTPLTISQGDDANVRVVTQAGLVSDPSRDFTLLIELPRLSDNQSHVGQLLMQECERQGGKKHKTVALATFIPRLPQQPAGAGAQAREIIFVVDGSGSMSGSPIQQALEAALFFVKDLPAAGNIRFNAAVFGSSHQMMWTACQLYNQATQQEAVQWLQRNVNSNWGGTEVLRVLQLIYERMPLGAATSRQIIFLTDGGVSGHEEEAIYGLVQGRAGSDAAKAAAARTSIFSLGIGHGVHRGLVEGVALKSGGMAQFVVDGEAIGRKAGLLKRCALAAEGGSLMKPRLVSRSCMVKAAPNVLPPRLFPDEPLHVLVQVVKAETGASLDLTASAPGANGQHIPYSISLPLDQAVRVPGDVFAVLHAMSSIGGLLAGSSSLHCSSDGSRHAKQPDAKQVEDAVVGLAEEEGLVSPYTSAVGVLLQKDPLDPETVKQVQVPLQLPAGKQMWKQQQQQQQAAAAYGHPHPHGGGRGRGGFAPRMAQASCGPSMHLQQQQQQQQHYSYSSSPSTTQNLFGAAPSPRCVPMPFGSAAPAAMAAPRAFGCSSPQPAVASFCYAPAATAAPSSFAFSSPQPAAMSPSYAAPPAMVNAAPVGFGFGSPAGASLAFGSSPPPTISSFFGSSHGAVAPAVDLLCEQADEEDSDLMDIVDDQQPKESLRQLEEKHKAADSAAASAAHLLPAQVLSLLNLQRTVEGAVLASQEVLHALAAEAFKQQRSSTSLSEVSASLMRAAARPAGLSSDDAWVTLLALAYLRKYLAAEQTVWAGLEAKAMEWLSGVWPSDVGKSIGSVVLAAMKLI